MTPSRPPAASSAGAAGSAWRSAPGSSLTAIRTAWNVRVATWRRRGHAARGTAPRTAATRSPVVRQGPATHDRPRDPSRVRLLAVLEEDARQLLPRGAVQRARPRGSPAVGIQPHVERLVRLERESAPRLLELAGRHAEIEENRARGAMPSRGAATARRSRKLGAHEADPVAERRQPLARPRERLGIHVQPEEAHRGAASAQDRLRVTAHPHRPIDHPSLPARPQEKHDLVGRAPERELLHSPRRHRSEQIGQPAAPCARTPRTACDPTPRTAAGPPPTSVTSFESPALARVGRDQNPPGRVDLDVPRPRDVEPAESRVGSSNIEFSRSSPRWPPTPPAGAPRGSARWGRPPAPVVPREGVPEPRRDAQAPLRIDRVLVPSPKHASVCRPPLWDFIPLRSTQRRH